MRVDAGRPVGPTRASPDGPVEGTPHCCPAIPPGTAIPVLPRCTAIPVHLDAQRFPVVLRFPRGCPSYCDPRELPPYCDSPVVLLPRCHSNPPWIPRCAATSVNFPRTAVPVRARRAAVPRDPPRAAVHRGRQHVFRVSCIPVPVVSGTAPERHRHQSAAGDFPQKFPAAWMNEQLGRR